MPGNISKLICVQTNLERGFKVVRKEIPNGEMKENRRRLTISSDIVRKYNVFTKNLKVF